MSAHRRAPRPRHALRRTVTAVVLAVTAGVGYLASAGPAQAAGPWYVATTGSNANLCTSAAAPCATVTGVLGKPGFVTGDTINVAQGTYTDHPTFGAKTANVIGGGTGATFTGLNATYAIGVNIGNANTLTLENLTLTAGRNLSNNLGGGLVIATGKVVANNVRINANGGGTISQGGGAYVAAGSGLTMNNGAVTNNSATNGGGIYGAGTTVLNGTTVTGNAATQSAGAIYAAGTTTVNGGTVSGNTALNAGGVFVAGTTIVDGTTLTGNAANGGAISNGGNGGAFYNAANLTVKNATLTGNKVVANTNATPGITGYGGAIFSANLAANAPAVTLTDTTIDGGSVSGGNAAVGGAIAVYPTTVGGTTSKVEGTRLTLSRNVALAGGGILSYGNVTLTDSVLDHNVATHASVGAGGGIYATTVGSVTPTLTLDSTDLTANSAVTNGGGAYTAAGVTTVVRNSSQVRQNAAAVGAGLYNGGTMTIRASGIVDNDASNSGAGVYTAGPLTVDDSAVAENTAAFLAGGIAAGGPLTVTGGQVNDNSAFGAGGLLVGDGIVASLDGTVVGGNTATGSGGGGILNSGRTTITRSSIINNHAVHSTGNTGLGGAIYSGSNNDNVTTTLKIGASTISGNDAYAGSALINLSSGDTGVVNTTSIDNTTIAGNHSSSAFGAIEQFHPLTITGSTITGNTADDPNAAQVAGGLAMFAPAQVGVAGSILAGNSGLDCSGSVADGGYNLSDDAGCGFTAGKHDVVGNPQLGALANNGGPTQTRLPGPASPALDRIPAGTATGLSDAISGSAVTLCGAGALDQRGTGRPQGAQCDIGAVEADQHVPVLDGPSEADYTVGAAGTPLQFTTTGSPQPTLSATGDLPAGVTFHDNGDGTGTLSGTPAAGTGGEHAITIKATNEAGSDTLSFTLKVHQAPVLSGPSASTYTVGEPGGPDVFQQTSGYPDATLSTDSDLPGGVTFTPQAGGKGEIAGTPAAGTGGVYPITIKGSNGTGPDATWPFELTVDEAPGITGPASVTFTAGTAGASGTYTGSGFPAPTFTGEGLPAGLAVVGTGAGTAKISGTPADGTGGEYDVTLTADNGVGEPATKDVHVVVNEAPSLTGPSAARFVAGRNAAVGFSADGYPGASLAVTGDLPDGLTFTDHGDGSATLGGTATTGAIGTYAVTVTASNGIDPDAVIHLTITVVPPPSITTTSLPNAAVGSGYSASVEATGGQPAYTFAVVSGSLPAGLSMNAAGQITGTPTGPTGTSAFTVKVTDSDDPADSDTQDLSITVVRGVSTLSVNPVVLQLNALGLRIGILKATLTGGSANQPIANQTIVFKAGSTTVCTGLTTADGTVTCKMDVVQTLQVILLFGVSATYPGNALWEPSTGSAGLIG
ncbi:MAG: putative Ig domain-containing protein [Nocardioidaceae bacterium]|nr:putative Ig domain-containing protein [Nocardioidaceae bacterium]